MTDTSSHFTKWQTYQTELQRTAGLKYYLYNRPLLLIIISISTVAILVAIFWAGLWFSKHWGQTSPRPSEPSKEKLDVPPAKLSRDDIPDLLNEINQDSSLLNDVLVCDKDGKQYTIRTTIDPKLQGYIQKLTNRSRTLQSVVVVLNPIDGRVIAMVNHDSNGNKINLSLKADYPAASLFKIVSAAAALEKSGYTPDTTLYFRGRRHTLYKSQLKQIKDRWTTKTSLRQAFGRSNNSVFGKLGIYVLGQKTLTEYAEKFAFNRSIPFDLTLAVSPIAVPADEFGLAEIASGFNKRTLISPLHATMLASVAANQGKMVTPWLVDTIQDEAGQILYYADTPVLEQSVNGKTAADLTTLMKYAARSGTGRKGFRKLRRKKLFRTFEFGAKTGTINDRKDRFKYDWIAAFALAPGGKDGIAIGVLGVHGKILGTRSTEMARAVIDYYFRM